MPSSVKMTMALSLINHLCFEKGRAVIFFSLEMSKEQVVKRLFVIQTGIKLDHVNENDWVRLAEATMTIGASKLVLDDTPALSGETISATCHSLFKKMNIDMVVVDYLQLMSSGNCESYAEEAIKNIHELKRLAYEINRPIIVFSQFRYHKGKTSIQDIHDFDKIKADIDDIILLHRVAESFEEFQNNTTVELYVIKNDRERSKAIKLWINPEKECFEDIQCVGSV